MSYDLGTAHGKIELEYNSHGAPAAVDKDMDKVDRKSKDTDKSLVKLGKTLSALGSGAKIGAIASAIGIAATQAAALTIQLLGTIPALTSILSLSAAIPGAFAAIGAAVTVLKLSFSGVGDAIKAAFNTKNPDKFNEALKKLSPSAAAFAIEIHKAAPFLTAFQKRIQESFFSASHLAGIMPLVVGSLKALAPQLNAMAGDFGEVTRQVANFALSTDSITFVTNAIATFRNALGLVTPSIVPILAGLRAVGTIGLPLLNNLGGAVSIVATKFADWLQAISSDGRLQAWISLALDTLSTLGDIAKNVGSILFSVIKAASAVGGGLLNVIAEITGQFATFLKSAEGSAAIRDLFAAIMTAARALSPVITTLVGALAQALAPALQQIAEVAGPVLLQVVKALAPAFGPLASALAGLIVALAPLLPPAAKLIALLAQLASVIANNLSAELGPLISLIADGLMGAFTALEPIIGAFAANLPLAAEAGIGLAKAFAPLVPALIGIAGAISGAIIQNMPAFTKALQDIVPIAIQFAQVAGKTMLDALVRLAPLIPPIVTALLALDIVFLRMAGFMLSVITSVIQFANAIQRIPGIVVGAIGAFIGIIVNGFNVVKNAVVIGINAIVSFFSALPGRVLSVLKALPGFLVHLFVQILQDMATVIGTGAGLVVGIFTRLPGRIISALASLGNSLVSIVSNAWSAAKNATVNGINATVSFARSLPGRIRSAISTMIGNLRSTASSGWASFKSATVNGVNSAISYVRGLPGRIRSAVGNLGGLLASAGHAVINGLINGIQSGISRVLGMVSDLGHRVKAAFNSALSIFSPSRVFLESGVSIDEGLIAGIQKKMGEVGRTAQALAKTVIDPTISLPTVSGMALAGVSALPAVKTAVAQSADKPAFGPYNLQVDQGTLVSFTIDAINGNPKVVAAANAEGTRQKKWNGSGRN
jgi:phage-related protein